MRTLLLLLFSGPLFLAAQTADELLDIAVAAGAKSFTEMDQMFTKVLDMELPPETRLRGLMMRGAARQAKGDRIGALIDFGDAIKLQPDESRCYFYRAESLRMSRRDDEAEKDYLKVLELDPKAVDPLIRLGEMKSAQRDYGIAITYYSRAIERAPIQSLSYTRRAEARASSGDSASAIADMDVVITLYPKDATLYHYRGVILYHSPGGDERAKAALIDFDKAIELNPGLARFYKDRANCRSMLGDSEGAAADVAKYNEMVRTMKK